MGKTAGVRRWGAAALDLAFVAAGRYDAFFEIGLAPWDVAAGILLVREAGGMMSDISGAPYVLAARRSWPPTPACATPWSRSWRSAHALPDRERPAPP